MALNIVSVGKWQKGRSGNPNGAPKRYEGATVGELCKAHTEEAVKQLVVMMRFKGPNQLPATLAILDRGWGKPAQHITSEGVDSVHLHLLAALEVQPLEAVRQADAPQERHQPLTIDGAIPTE